MNTLSSRLLDDSSGEVQNGRQNGDSTYVIKPRICVIKYLILQLTTSLMEQSSVLYTENGDIIKIG
jgi:hypothetical protein